MSSESVTIRVRKLMKNPLLGRRQFVIDVVHPGKPSQSKTELAAAVAKLYKVPAPGAKLVVLSGFKTAFGGGRSTGFGLIYDSLEDMKKFEPKYRLVRAEEGTKKTRTRKQWKDAKRKAKRTFGTGRRATARAAKKAAAS